MAVPSIVGFNAKRGFYAAALPLSQWVDARVVAANVSETVTVPAGAQFAIFNSNIDFYIKSGGAAAVPAADVTDGTGSALNPQVIAVTPADTFGVISASAGIITISYYGSSAA